MAATCSSCGALQDVGECGLCDACIESRTHAELDPTDDLDPAVRLRIAELLGLTDPLEKHPAA